MPLYPEQYVYELQAVLPTQANGNPGGNVPLYAVCESVQWEESNDELSVRLQARMRNFNVEPLSRKLSEVLEVGMPVLLSCNYQDGVGPRNIFEGRIFDIHYEDQSVETLTITAYDGLIQLQKSQDVLQVFTPTLGSELIKKLFNFFVVPYSHIDGPTTPFPGPNILRGATIAEMLIYIFRECFIRGSDAYMARMVGSKAEVVKEGGNDPIYYLSYQTGISSIQNEDSIQDLVTVVKVWSGPIAMLPDPMGGPNMGGPYAGQEPIGYYTWDPETQDIVLGATSKMTQKFGVLQNLITGGQADTPENMKLYAKEILQARGQKVTTKTIVAPDIPHLRRGHYVFVNAGPVNGEYTVTGVQHSAERRQMTVTIDSHGVLGRKYKRTKTPGLLPDPALVAPMPTDAYGNVQPNTGRPF